MTFWTEDKNKKPDRWGFDKGLTDPKWEWFWRDSFLSFPLWEGHDRPFSLVNNPILTINNTPVWRRRSRGMVLRSNSSLDAWVVPHFPEMDVTELTIAVVAEWALDSTTLNVTLLNYGTTTAGSWTIFRFNTSSDGVTIQVRVDSGTSRLIEGPTLTQGREYKIVLTYKDPNLRIYVDGVLRGTESTGGTLDTDRGDLWLGSHVSAANTHWNEPVSLYHFSGRAWSPAEIVEWSRDPFGPFHMVNDTETLIEGTGAVAAGVLNLVMAPYSPA